jgi:hypothetical protein
VALVTLGSACGKSETREPAATAPVGTSQSWSVTIKPLSPPASTNSVAPQLTTSGQGTILSWIERAGERSTLRYVERTPDGWSAPYSVVSGSDWFVSWADVPSVLRLSSGTIVADWFVNTREEIEAYDLHLSYSKDGGRTWAAPFRAHRDRTQTQHGFATLFEMPDKRLGLVWLDGRDMETTKDPQGGVMTLRFTSFDSSWTHAADVPVNVRVCECCQTAAVVTADGVLTAFRDRSEKEIRDIAVSRLDNGSWTDARIVHADNFETDSCPVNGPSLSARGRDVAVAWFAPTENDGHAFAAFSHDAGRTWSAPTRLDDRQSLGYTDIELLEDGSAVATWVEFADQRRQLAMRHIDGSGKTSPSMVIAGTGAERVSGYPRMARYGDELVFAWTESSPVEGGEEPSQQIKGAVARLPRTTAP